MAGFSRVLRGFSFYLGILFWSVLISLVRVVFCKFLIFGVDSGFVIRFLSGLSRLGEGDEGIWGLFVRGLGWFGSELVFGFFLRILI